MSQKYEKLKTLLLELFQLDQPELDFGIYRVMHAKSAEVTQFLEKDLLPQVKSAFAQYQPADKAAIEKELAKAIEQARALGADPETLPKVKELRARLASEAVDLDKLEAEVYDHLYSFFRRYYSEGDFLSKRVYKPGVYAIPYEGEEVKLHWANADQYYIKTSEYLRDYAFRLRPDDVTNPMRVHFRLVDAAEGEHGNVKEQAGKERRFKLAPAPFAALENGELVIRFTYQPDPAKQKELNAEAETAILGLTDAALADWIAALKAKHVRADGTQSESTRLRVHLDRYTARNTFDYFIHKDLGGFLRRELDFYIKNEVMHLDDVENETVPRVEQYLSKIKVIRKIAGKIIDFLAQLEDFQKKLWLKKKFVVETSWCIRLGVIPEALYPEIAENDAQREEWVRLCGIDALKATEGSLLEPGKPGYSVPLTVEFLKAHPTLMVDTRHFAADFTARLLEAMSDLDELTDGVLVHSENFQALSLMQARYRERVKCVYIDPPYNTGSDEFTYKDRYQHSSWLAMMTDRLFLMSRTLKPDGTFFTSIDHNEISPLKAVLDDVFQADNVEGLISWRRRHNQPNDRTKMIGLVAEYLLAYAKDGAALRRSGVGKLDLTGEFSNPDNDPRGDWASKPWKVGAGQSGTRYVIETPTGKKLDEEWMGDESTYKALLADNRIIFPRGGDGFPRKKYFKFEREEEGQCAANWWEHSYFGHNAGANATMTALFGEKNLISNPKPVELIRGVVQVAGRVVDLVADFFAGSGTTGHAVINLNREDGGQRKFILVEQADYFDTVLLPRLEKVTFTPEWKDGKPKRLATAEEAERSPRIFKIIRLESYEDTLNNLELRRTKEQQSLLDLAAAQGPDKLKEQYILRYMLDVESRGSASLLNIAAFTDPTAYTLKVKRPGSDESREVKVDLLETFNWLIGLTVQHIAAPRRFTATFKRDDDPDLPKDAPRRLLLDGRLKEDPSGPWWFRTVTGTTPDGRKTLIIWRNRPGGEAPEGVEQDNLVLDEWFKKQGYSSKDSECDLIYVNGTNNLENLKAPDDTWKVRLIEEDFFRLMFKMEGV